MDVELEWQLFKTAVASSAARVYGQKQVIVVNNGILLDPSKTNVLSYSAMSRTSLADGECI